MVGVLVCAATSVIIGCVCWARHLAKDVVPTHQLPLPPGPKRRPIAGNALELPTEYPWLVYREWAKQHGDVMCLNAFGQPMLVLDTAQAVSDLLVKRGAKFSSRRIPVYVDKSMGFEFAMSNAPYGSRWHRMRKALRPHVAISAITSYSDAQSRCARQMLGELMIHPERFREHNRAFFGRIMMDTIYGIRDPAQVKVYTNIVDECWQSLARAVNPGPHFVLELVPVLRHLPVWKHANRVKGLLQRLMDEPLAYVKARMGADSVAPSIISKLLNTTGKSHDLTANEIRDLCAVIHGGGAHTTVSALDVFYLAMTLYPSCQRVAQEELDAVVGRSRLPDLNDLPRLPYIHAIVSETLRWNPATPLEEEYRGWRIPAGTVVLGNVWSILHDPCVYPNPGSFNLERYLVCAAETSLVDPLAHLGYGSGGSSWAPRPDAPDPRTAAFGFGRRICPGIHLADAALFLSIASVLACFNISPAPGTEVPVCNDASQLMTGGYVSYPKDFKCTIQPRHPAVEELVKAPSR